MPAAPDDADALRTTPQAQGGPVMQSSVAQSDAVRGSAGESMSAAADDPGAGVTFEAHLGELQRIVAALERGELGLDESLSRFEQGIGLLRRCQRMLAGAEQRIELLTGFTADGTPVTRPFDSSATFVDRAPSAAGEPVENEGKRKRARRSVKPDADGGEAAPGSDETPRLF